MSTEKDSLIPALGKTITLVIPFAVISNVILFTGGDLRAASIIFMDRGVSGFLSLSLILSPAALVISAFIITFRYTMPIKGNNSALVTKRTGLGVLMVVISAILLPWQATILLLGVTVLLLCLRWSLVSRLSKIKKELDSRTGERSTAEFFKNYINEILHSENNSSLMLNNKPTRPKQKDKRLPSKSTPNEENTKEVEIARKIKDAADDEHVFFLCIVMLAAVLALVLVPQKDIIGSTEILPLEVVEIENIEPVLVYVISLSEEGNYLKVLEAISREVLLIPVKDIESRQYCPIESSSNSLLRISLKSIAESPRLEPDIIEDRGLVGIMHRVFGIQDDTKDFISYRVGNEIPQSFTDVGLLDAIDSCH